MILRPPFHTYATIDIMTFTKKPLVIIPGLGDRAKLYRLVIPVWKLLGYEPYIFSFGWEDTNENFESAIKRLTDHIDNLQATRVNIIGVSAGGTAAINALSLRSNIVERVVTVATPYRYLRHLKSTKLNASIDRLRQVDINNLKPRVLSIHGLYDQTVPTGASQPKDIRVLRVYTANHGCIIIAALTIYSLAIRRFIEQG